MAGAYSTQDIRAGAIYRLGAARGFNRETVVRLLIDRAEMKPAAAMQLAGHWLTTEPYRSSDYRSARRANTTDAHLIAVMQEG